MLSSLAVLSSPELYARRQLGVRAALKWGQRAFVSIVNGVRIHRESGNGVPIHLENLEGWEVGGGGWEHRKMVGGGGWGEGGGNIGNGVLFFERRFLL